MLVFIASYFKYDLKKQFYYLIIKIQYAIVKIHSILIIFKQYSSDLV